MRKAIGKKTRKQEKLRYLNKKHLKAKKRDRRQFVFIPKKRIRFTRIGSRFEQHKINKIKLMQLYRKNSLRVYRFNLFTFYKTLTKLGRSFRGNLGATKFLDFGKFVSQCLPLFSQKGRKLSGSLLSRFYSGKRWGFISYSRVKFLLDYWKRVCKQQLKISIFYPINLLKSRHINLLSVFHRSTVFGLPSMSTIIEQHNTFLFSGLPSSSLKRKFFTSKIMQLISLRAVWRYPEIFAHKWSVVLHNFKVQQKAFKESLVNYYRYKSGKKTVFSKEWGRSVNFYEWLRFWRRSEGLWVFPKRRFKPNFFPGLGSRVMRRISLVQKRVQATWFKRRRFTPPLNNTFFRSSKYYYVKFILTQLKLIWKRVLARITWKKIKWLFNKSNRRAVFLDFYGVILRLFECSISSVLLRVNFSVSSNLTAFFVRYGYCYINGSVNPISPFHQVGVLDFVELYGYMTAEELVDKFDATFFRQFSMRKFRETLKKVSAIPSWFEVSLYIACAILWTLPSISMAYRYYFDLVGMVGARFKKFWRFKRFFSKKWLDYVYTAYPWKIGGKSFIKLGYRSVWKRERRLVSRIRNISTGFYAIKFFNYYNLLHNSLLFTWFSKLKSKFTLNNWFVTKLRLKYIKFRYSFRFKNFVNAGFIVKKYFGFYVCGVSLAIIRSNYTKRHTRLNLMFNFFRKNLVVLSGAVGEFFIWLNKNYVEKDIFLILKLLEYPKADWDSMNWKMYFKLFRKSYRYWNLRKNFKPLASSFIRKRTSFTELVSVKLLDHLNAISRVEKYARRWVDRGDGYDLHGFGIDGFDISGTNRHGFSRDGFNKFGLNTKGYNRSGYDHLGFNKTGYDRKGLTWQGFDRSGYNRAGYNYEGYKRNGYDSHGFDKEGYRVDGFDGAGFDRDGLNRNGLRRVNIWAKPPMIAVLCDYQEGYSKVVDKRIFVEVKGQRVQWIRCGPRADLLSVLQGLGFYKAAKLFPKGLEEKILQQSVNSSVRYEPQFILNNFQLDQVKEYEVTPKLVKLADQIRDKKLRIKLTFESRTKDIKGSFRLKHNFLFKSPTVYSRSKNINIVHKPVAKKRGFIKRL